MDEGYGKAATSRATLFLWICRLGLSRLGVGQWRCEDFRCSGSSEHLSSEHLDSSSGQLGNLDLISDAGKAGCAGFVALWL